MSSLDKILEENERRKRGQSEQKEAKAVALQYGKEKDYAPRIVAKGQGRIAEQILAIAAENNVPIHEDKSLVEILSVLEMDSFIPLEAYTAVAEILSYIYKKNAAAR